MAQADLAIPTLEDAPDLPTLANTHLKAARHHRLHGPRASFDVLGGNKDKGKYREEDEVDDDWFQVQDDEEARRFVRLSIGKVPRRAGTMIKRRIRGRGGKKVPAVVIEEDGGEARFELEEEEDEGGAPFGTEPSRSTFTDEPFQASPTSSADSLVTLDLPMRPTAGGGSTTPSSSRSQTPYNRSPFTPLTTLPTLSELRSFDSTSSSSPSTSVRSPSPADTPTRTLSIDGSARPGVKRTTSRSTFKGSQQHHRLHLPGRPRFSMRRKKPAGRVDSTLENSAAFDAAVAQALKKAGVIGEEQEKVETDVLYEHQRGIVVFGIPKFSSAALLQVDPSEWCDASLKPSPFSPHDYPCPPYWHWRDSEFMVDMSGDKDEEGWSYARRFRSRFWRGEAVFPHSFVRRRLWIRTRVYRPDPVLPSSLGGASASAPSAAASALDLGTEAFEDVEAEEEESEVKEIKDLRTACRCLPLNPERRAALFAESSSAALRSGAVDPRNPFVSFRRVKLEALATHPSSSGGGEAAGKEGLWRDAVREINYRRVLGVLKAYGKIDRKRLDLWRLWLGERKKGAKEGEEEKAGEGEKEGRPEMEDVWDVIEGRLDPLLSTFDYNLSRLSFLRLVLALHPAKATSHRHEGYDAAPARRKEILEEKLEGRLSFYQGVEELVKEYEFAEKEQEGGREKAGDGAAKGTPRKKRTDKGKGRA
ncbi:hypothetical protein JCM8097_002202 [Rhodosporidiobolus ruineniae]